MARKGAIEMELDAVKARLDALEAALKQRAPKNQPKEADKAAQAKEAK
jgi:hypothetical protein